MCAPRMTGGGVLMAVILTPILGLHCSVGNSGRNDGRDLRAQPPGQLLVPEFSEPGERQRHGIRQHYAQPPPALGDPVQSLNNA